MAIGDIVNPKRVRTQANERVDTVDADALSFVAREAIDAYSRAVEAAPRAVGSSTPTGLIIQGFGLTLNPTGPTDGKVRVQSAVGVAFDANGRLLVKENGVQVDLTVPSGSSQVYAYYVESASDTAVRRFISVSPPFTESPQSISTKFKSDVSFFVRAGDQTSIVSSDVVNGATTALCFLGVAINTTGTVTMTGYNASTAPNGAFATNRLTSVATPSTLPPANTANGSITTMHGLINAALFAIGQAVWRGSRNFTPSAANNFGAFTIPTIGLDALFDSAAESTVTPITAWRDWNLRRRALIDHNGYHMGQVSEESQEWYSGVRTIRVPIAGSWSPGTVVANQGSTRSLANGSPPPYTALNVTTAGAVSQSFFGAIQLPPGTIVKNVSLIGKKVGAADSFSVVIYSDNTFVGSVFSGSLASGAATGAFSVALTQNVPNFATPVADTLIFQIDTSNNNTSALHAITLDVVEDPAGWVFTSTVDTAGSVAPTAWHEYNDPSVNVNQRTVRLVTQQNASAAIASSGILTKTSYEAFLNADVCYVQEWILRTGVVDSSFDRLFAAGIQNNNAGGGNRFVYFYNQNNTANWSILVVGSSTVNNDTGVAIAANTTYRMRLEILGANVSTAGAGAFRVRGFINGVKVVDVVTSQLPTADSIRPYFQIGTTIAAPSTPALDCSIGRVRRAWNHLLVGDNL